jgi:hypothetical protein
VCTGGRPLAAVGRELALNHGYQSKLERTILCCMIEIYGRHQVNELHAERRRLDRSAQLDKKISPDQDSAP